VKDVELAHSVGVRRFPSWILTQGTKTYLLPGNKKIEEVINFIESDHPNFEVPSFLAESQNETKSDTEAMSPQELEILKKVRELQEKGQLGDTPNEQDEEQSDSDWPADPDSFVFSSSNFDEITSKGIWLIDFYAPWCPHCKNLAPLWANLATKVKTDYKGQLNIGKVDADILQDVSKQYSVSGLPTVLLLREGKIYEYDSDYTIEDLIKFALKDYKNSKSRESPNKLLAPDFFSNICGERCEKLLKDGRIIFGIALIVCGSFFYLLYGFPSTPNTLKTATRRRKKK